MTRGSLKSGLIAILVVLMASFGASAYAQGGGSSSTLSGTVSDTSGGIMPGVDVVAKHNGTGAAFTAVTDAVGRFTIPAMPPGTYTVTIALSGFKTVVLPDVTLVTNTPVSVKAVLEVGALQETVVVTGAAEVVQTQSAEVQTTVSIKQISSLPVVSRTALDYVVSLPGVETPGSVTRSSTINGLPTTSMNITLDGVNVQDKRGSEGFFMYIRPLMDSVEEITVSTSNPGAESSGSGASQIRMTTRGGTNRFSGSAYNTWRNQAGVSSDDVLTRKKGSKFLWGLNTPYWFNKRDLPKTAAGDYFINDVRLQTPGFRVGGPILKDKLFYFFNYEEFRLPESRSRTRYLLNEQARQGNFSYTALDGSTRTINLLTLAAANKDNRGQPQVSTMDPSISKLLGDIRQATTTTGAVSGYDLLLDKFDYDANATQKRTFPTLRMDYNLTAAHRVSFVGRYNSFNSTPDFLNNADPAWPGFPNQGAQVSGRYMWQTTVRSTIGKSMVNEVRVGAQDATGLGSYFGKGVNASMFDCTGVGCQAAGGKGWNFQLPALSATLNGATAYNTSSAGVASQLTFEDNFNWLKGKHSISSGFSFTRIDMRNWTSTPTYSTLQFGTASVDPAYGMLDPTSGNFPGGINTTQANYARTLYGLLTGRVTSFGGTAYLQPDGSYAFQGERTNGTVADDYGFFVSDSWRVKPNLTVNAGVRWEVQLPMTTDGLYSRPETWQMVYGITGAGSGNLGQGNLYKPGVLNGVNPSVVKYENNRPAYNTDWNNFAPSVGAAWRPNLKKGLLSTILSTDPVFRGGYSLSYTKLGTSFFDSNYSGNPGRSRAAGRTITTGTPVLGVDAAGKPAVYPVLLRDTSRLVPSTYPSTISYPLTPANNETIDIHYPDWPVPKTHQYSFGFQRALGKTMALELRYVGNTNVGGWTTFNMTANAQWSMLSGENGFYDEFRLAQQNLRANITQINPATNKPWGNTFAYTGAAGTSPLPIFMAFLQGIPLNDARNKVPGNYTASQFTNSAWYNQLNMYSPALTAMAGTGANGLQNTLLEGNAAKAGLPVNFFQANPAMKSGNAYLETNAGNTRYNSIQIDLRKQMSKGLLVQGSYIRSFGRQTWGQRSLREDWFYMDSTGGPDHSFKVNWAYELPFGQGKQFVSGASRWMEALVGGWEIDGVGRIQSGAKFNYGGFRLVGMSEKEFQDMFKFYHIPDATTGVDRVYMLPKDVIEQSIVAIYTTSATSASGYAGASPTGRYLAPASGPDCVQYLSGQCPGTAITRIVTGPMYGKLDMSFVKRFSLPKNMKIEARMDLYNVLNTINFNAIGPSSTTSTTGMGSSFTNWQVTSAAQDVNGSQDPGGRVTSFGLRLLW